MNVPYNRAIAPTISREKLNRYTSYLQSLLDEANGKSDFIFIDDEVFTVQSIRALHDQLVIDPLRFASGTRKSIKVASAFGFYNNIDNPNPGNLSGANDPWPNGNIYYEFDSGVIGVGSTQQYRQNQFLAACREWEAVAHIKFIDHDNQQSFLKVKNAVPDSNGRTGSSATIGMIYAGPNLGQIFDIAEWDSPGIIQHEIGHSIGLLHEHQRSDRGEYVTINTGNIEFPATNSRNFEIFPVSFADEQRNRRTAFDFGSIMTYSRNAVSVEPSNPDKHTIEPQPAHLAQSGGMGQRIFLSYFDKQAASDLYGPPVGYLDIATRSSDNSSALLLSDASFNASTANLSANVDGIGTTNLGSEGGWRPKKLRYGPDGSVWMLRTNADGRASVQKRSGASVLSDTIWQNSGEQFVDFAIGPDGRIRLLQQNRDGSWRLWMDSESGMSYSPPNVPGNFARAVTVGSDNKTRVLIESNQTNGQFVSKAWTIGPPTNSATFTFESSTSNLALTGTGTDIAVDSTGNIDVMWIIPSYGPSAYSGGVRFSRWRTNGTIAYTGEILSPNGANRPVSFTVGADGKIRVLWNNFALRYYFVDKYSSEYQFEKETPFTYY